ncbi:hypothetical protein SBA4_2040009 [Candidatus Sulfopaludibacter sp. SbA4]|nr:hypothetical protein SBA4_2040009 [Candidatus Sulfopaludibacter sp. SbA4]
MASDSDVKPDSQRLWRSALFQPEGVRGAHVRGAPGGDECCDERAGGEDQCGGGDGCGIGGSDAEQLRLDEFVEGGDARQREGHAGGDHGGGIAQHEAKGRGASSTEREADSDFARAARHDERHHTIKADQRKQQRQGAEAAGERGEHALGIEGAVDLVVEGAEPEDRQPRVVLADQAADGGNGLLGSAANLDIEGSAGVVALEEREKDLLGVITETAIAHVGDDADDGAIGLDVRVTAPGDADAEGIAAGQIALDEGLVHDGATGTDLAGGTGVALVEIAAGEEANAEGGEETGADGVEVDAAIAHDAPIGLDRRIVAPGTAGEEGKSGSGGGTDGGQGADLLVEAADQARGVGAGVAVFQRSNGEGEEAGRIEAGPFGQQAGERAQEQGGANEEDEGEGYLEGDDGFAQADSPEAGASALAERVDDVVAAGVQSRGDAAEEAGGETGEEGESEEVEADAGTERVGGQVVGQECDEGPHGGRGEGDAEDAAGEGEQEAIGQKLAADAGARGAEREAGGELAGAGRAAGEEEAGDVEAGEASEQDPGGGEQEPQRLGQAAAQWRMALGSGSEDEARREIEAALLDGDDREPGAAGAVLEPGPEPGKEAGLRLRGGDTGAEAGEDLQPAGGVVEEILIGVEVRVRVHGRGNPEGRHGADVDAAEAGGGHADYGHGVIADQDLAAGDIGSAAELRLPEVIREHDDRTGAGRGIVFGFDDAAECGADAEHGEVAAGDDLSGDGPGVAAGCQVDLDFGAAEDALEEAGLLLEFAADGVRHQVKGADAAGDEVVAVPIDENQAPGLADGQRVKDHLIDKGIDRGDGADAERKREQRSGGEGRATEERAHGEAEVVEEIAEPAAEPDIADFLADLGEAELDGGAAAGLGLGDAGGGEVGDAAIEVILDLPVEAALQRAAAEPVEEPDHRLPSSKIRLTAPERRAQLSFSTASCLRPAGVRQ